MKKYKSVRLVPVNKTVEGDPSLSKISMDFKILNSLVLGVKPVKSKLNKAQRELFLAFQQEQRRLNQIAEKQLLKKYLLEQRAAVNKMASYIRKRNEKELKTYGQLPAKISVTKSKYYLGAPISKFKITNDVKDLRSKIDTLDEYIFRLRQAIESYEHEDYFRWDRENGGWNERLKKRLRRNMRKVA